ncbi:MAG: FecCD family ABC transporter permease [Acidiferrobacterales bacterium]
MKTGTKTLILLLLSVACIWIGLVFGSTDVGTHDLFDLLTGKENTSAQILILDIRLPRTLAAFTVGGLLALSGLLLQALLRNPLADPYVLGVSGGASLGALLAILLGFGLTVTHASAFSGAMLSMLLVFSLGRVRSGNDAIGLLLTGVIVAAGWGALISLILVIGTDTNIQGMLFWLMGDLGRARQYSLGIIVLVTGTIIAWILARPLNLAVQGDRVVAALGSNPQRVRYAIYFLASVLTGTAVSLAGNIAFVGLVVPHLLRLTGATDHRVLVPQVVLLGGSLLLISDTLARTIIAPQQLPVGIVTAFLGVPGFLYLLIKSRAQ